MEIPLLNALVVKIIRRVNSQLLPPTVEKIYDNVELNDPVRFYPDEFEYSVYARVGYISRAPKGCEQQAREKAVQAILHHIYGPIENELRTLKEELWALGVPDNTAAMKRVDEMIVTLRGQ